MSAVIFPGLSVHTPPDQEESSGTEYTITHSGGYKLTLYSSNSFTARGRSSKKHRVQKSNQLNTTLIHTHDLPFNELMRFMKSPGMCHSQCRFHILTNTMDPENPHLKDLFLKYLCAAEGYSANRLSRPQDDDEEISGRNEGLNQVSKCPNSVLFMKKRLVMFVFSMFCSNFTAIQVSLGRLSMKIDVRHTILQRLKHSVLERHEGDLRNRLDRLLGSTTTSDAFYEALTIALQLGSNSMQSLDTKFSLIRWLGNQSMLLLEALFEIKLSSTWMFLDQLMKRTCDFDE